MGNLGKRNPKMKEKCPRQLEFLVKPPRHSLIEVRRSLRRLKRIELSLKKN